MALRHNCLDAATGGRGTETGRTLHAFSPRRLLIVVASLLLASCAAEPPRQTAEAGDASAVRGTFAPTVLYDRVRLDVASALPLLEDTSSGEELFESALTFSSDELFTYRAAYTLAAGDLVSRWGTEPAKVVTPAPSQIGVQQVVQDVQLELPELAGAPLSLAFNTELGNKWLVSDTAAFRRERARLDWSPGPAVVSVQWSGTPVAANGSSALGCALESSIRLPTYEEAGSSQDVRLSGRSCVVAAEGIPRGDLQAQAVDLRYVWQASAGRRIAAGLSVIEPRSGFADLERDAERGYELDVLHSRDLGPFRAQASVAFRRPGSWYFGGLPGASLHPGDGDPHWAADATLTWDLSRAALSANFAVGTDPLWFAPELGHRRDRFGLALDFSRWIGAMTDGPEPRLGMNWNWSRPYAPENPGESSLHLDVALVF